jgi:hypothetical protein
MTAKKGHKCYQQNQTNNYIFSGTNVVDNCQLIFNSIAEL